MLEWSFSRCAEAEHIAISAALRETSRFSSGIWGIGPPVTIIVCAGVVRLLWALLAG